MNTFNSPLEAFLYWEKHAPNRTFLKQFTKKDPKIYSYKNVGKEIRKFAAALNTYNLPKRSNIAILAKNSPYWVMADLAIMMADHVSVPIDTKTKPEVVNKILVHSESKIIIIDTSNDYEKQENKLIDIPKISIDIQKGTNSVTWKNLIKNQSPVTKPNKRHKDDLLTIVYTSGTTESPKGVMHTSNNFMESVYAYQQEMGYHLKKKLPENIKIFSYMSLTHIAERNASITNGLIFRC